MKNKKIKLNMSPIDIFNFFYIWIPFPVPTASTFRPQVRNLGYP